MLVHWPMREWLTDVWGVEWDIINIGVLLLLILTYNDVPLSDSLRMCSHDKYG